MLANAIAEMRTYGEGFIIADQAPGLLDLSVIRNTNTKIIMRLPDRSDRELVGGAANLNDDQIVELAKLPCGVAAIYQNEWIQPVLCKVNKFEMPQEMYSYSPDNEGPQTDYDGSMAAESRLDCIMNREIFQQKNRKDLIKLKFMIIKSKLDINVKRDFIEYISSSDENAIGSLRHLVYDFFAAGEAIKASEHCSEIMDWVHSVVSGLKPLITNYSSEQIDLVLSMILYEQSLRDSAYQNIFCRFTEIYSKEGRVF